MEAIKHFRKVTLETQNYNLLLLRSISTVLMVQIQVALHLMGDRNILCIDDYMVDIIIAFYSAVKLKLHRTMFIILWIFPYNMP